LEGVSVAYNGMDLEAAERLARLMDTYRTNVSQIGARMSATIDSLPWWGADAEAFKSKDLAELKRLVKMLVEDASLLSDDCRRNLADQRKVSGT
jgi:hypothetical protein